MIIPWPSGWERIRRAVREKKNWYTNISKQQTADFDSNKYERNPTAKAAASIDCEFPVSQRLSSYGVRISWWFGENEKRIVTGATVNFSTTTTKRLLIRPKLRPFSYLLLSTYKDSRLNTQPSRTAATEVYRRERESTNARKTNRSTWEWNIWASWIEKRKKKKKINWDHK